MKKGVGEGTREDKYISCPFLLSIDVVRIETRKLIGPFPYAFAYESWDVILLHARFRRSSNIFVHVLTK